MLQLEPSLWEPRVIGSRAWVDGVTDVLAVMLMLLLKMRVEKCGCIAT